MNIPITTCLFIYPPCNLAMLTVILDIGKCKVMADHFMLHSIKFLIDHLIHQHTHNDTQGYIYTGLSGRSKYYESLLYLSVTKHIPQQC